MVYQVVLYRVDCVFRWFLGCSFSYSVSWWLGLLGTVVAVVFGVVASVLSCG